MYTERDNIIATYYLMTQLISLHFTLGTIKSRWHSSYVLWSIELVAYERIVTVTAAVSDKVGR